MGFHKSQPVGEIHQTHNWSVADAAARAALVLVAGDIGKVCRQADTTDLWILKNNVGPVWFNLTPAAYSSSDMLSVLTAAEIVITAAGALTIGRMHNLQGTAADYTVTLPAVAGNAGKFLGIRIDPAATRWFTIDGNAAELIDGALTRAMWRYESAILYCDGVSWTKVAGKSIPIKVSMKRTAAFAMTFATWSIIPTVNLIADNSSFMATPAGDTANGRVRCLRAGDYQISGRVSVVAMTVSRLFAGGAMVGNFVAGAPNTPGGWGTSVAPSAGAAAGLAYGSSSATVIATTADFFYLMAYLDDTANRNTNTGADTLPFITVTEVPSW